MKETGDQFDSHRNLRVAFPLQSHSQKGDVRRQIDLCILSTALMSPALIVLLPIGAGRQSTSRMFLDRVFFHSL
jgi:hypothetical protein